MTLSLTLRQTGLRVGEGGDGGDVLSGADVVPGGDVLLGEGNLTAIREQRKAELCLEVRAGTPGVNTATAGPSFDKKLSQFRSSILFGQKLSSASSASFCSLQTCKMLR